MWCDTWLCGKHTDDLGVERSYDRRKFYAYRLPRAVERRVLNYPVPHLLTRGVAERLGISTRTVERWRITGEGPKYIRAGARRVLYPLPEVERWEAARLHASRAAELAGAA